MYFETIDNELVIMSSVIMVGSIVSQGSESYYSIHLTGGQHVNIREASTSRADFITTWKAANI